MTAIRAAAKSPAMLIAALAFIELTAAFETLLVYAAMKEFLRVFEDPHGVGLLVIIYLVAQTISAVIGGRLGDIFGRRKVMFIVLALAVVGSIISALAENLWLVILGRAIQGCAGAILPLAFGLAYEQLRDGKAQIAVGIISGTAIVSAGIALVIGGIIVDHLGWRFIFVFSAALSVLAIIALWLSVAPSPAQPRKKLDYTGGLLFIGAMLAVLTSVNGSRYIGVPVAVVLGFIGILLTLYWIWFEYRHANPLIDVRLVANRYIFSANMIKFTSAAGVGQMSLIFSMLLQQSPLTGVGLGLTATFAGLLIMPSNLVGIIFGPLTGWLCTHHGGRMTAIFGMGLLALSSLGFYFHHHTIIGVLVLLVIKGAGITITFASVPLIALPHAPNDRKSEVAAVTTLFRGAGQILGASVITFVIATWTVGGGVYPSNFAYELLFLFGFGVSLIGIVVAWFIPRHRSTCAVSTVQYK